MSQDYIPMLTANAIWNIIITNDNDIWIQGIGSVEGFGLLHPISEYITNGDVVTVACVKKENLVLYLNNPICDKCFCTLYTGNRQFDKSIESIKVFPNPIKCIIF